MRWLAEWAVRRREGIGTCTVTIAAFEAKVIYGSGFLACIAPTAGPSPTTVPWPLPGQEYDDRKLPLDGRWLCQRDTHDSLGDRIGGCPLLSPQSKRMETDNAGGSLGTRVADQWSCVR
jgi:hypothetical protein